MLLNDHLLAEIPQWLKKYVDAPCDSELDSEMEVGKGWYLSEKGMEFS